MRQHWMPCHLTEEGRQMAEDKLRWAGVSIQGDIDILLEEYEDQLSAGAAVPLPADDMSEWIAAHTMPSPPHP